MWLYIVYLLNCINFILYGVVFVISFVFRILENNIVKFKFKVFFCMYVNKCIDY